MDIEKLVREYIKQTIHLSLATARVNKPWVCEVHFVYDDNLNLYFSSKTVRRHSQEIADNPFVAGNIVKQHELGESPHGIYFEGEALHLTDKSEVEAAAKLYQEKLDIPGAMADEALKDPASHQFYKITVANWYAFGKFGLETNQKYELKWNGGKK